MLRTLTLVTLLGFSSTFAVADPVPKPAKPVAPAKPDFPIPKDASTPTDAPGGGGAILLYQIPRGRDVVVAELRELLKAGGFTITKDDPSPSGRAIRLEVKKGANLYKVSFTGDATRTAMILTLP